MKKHEIKLPAFGALLATSCLTILLSSAGVPALAQQATPPQATTQPPASQQAAEVVSPEVETFCNELLNAHPEGGKELTTEVKSLVAAAPEAASDVVACGPKANDKQAKAIGTGLAKFVAGLKNKNPELADKIAKLVAGSSNKAMKTAYLSGSAGEATASTPGQGGGGEGGTGGTPTTGIFQPTSAPVPILVVSPGGGGGGGTVSPN